MGTPPPPLLSPTVATPLAHRKRRHSEINGADPQKISTHEAPKKAETKSPVQSRLQVPHPRGRSATPVKRERSATPASASAKTTPVKSNGKASTRPNGAARPSASPRPNIASRASASPRPGVISRPSASPRPVTFSRPGASPRPSAGSRPSASPRPATSHRASASPYPRSSVRPSASPRPTSSVTRRIDDSSSDGDSDSDLDKSDIEDILDSAELQPFTLATEDDDPAVLDAETSAKLKQRLLDVGPESFMTETLENAQMPPSMLGTAFGLDPRMAASLGEEIFLRILGQMVVRHYFKRQKLPQYNNLDDVAELLKKSEKVIVIAGAGISTSLGIPDFRSKGSGFYDRARLKAERLGYELNEAEEVFDIELFDERPEIFYTLASDILPDERKFSPTHAFIKLLQDKGKLLTCYTQNIDNLEQSAGIHKDKLIQCHGSFASATCRRKGVKNPSHTLPGSDTFPNIRAGDVAYCALCDADIEKEKAAKKAQEQRKKRFKLTPSTKRTPTPSFADDDDEDDDDDTLRRGVMKPDITFFGEQLPDTFFARFTERDCAAVDLVLVLGTSLKVAPVSEMPNYLPHRVPHVYVSREAIRHVEFDVQCLGDCDDVVVELCRRAGWSGRDGEQVLGHEMVEALDREGRAIVVEEEEGGDGFKWRVRRQQ